MRDWLIPVILFIAALLEVGGDALVRIGLYNSAGSTRVITLAGGFAVLAAYGLFVNATKLDFGRMLGVYIAIFFVVAQAINAIVFGNRPTPSLLLGGACIIAGGAIIGLRNS